MRISQEKVFTPITITLETAEEAASFIDIIDKVDRHQNNANDKDFKLSDAERAMIIRISDFFTNCSGYR